MNQNPIIKAVREDLAKERLELLKQYGLEKFPVQNIQTTKDFTQDVNFARRMTYSDSYKSGHEAATERLLPILQKAIEALELCDNWFQEIYPKDIFIGGPNADEGVNRVVEMREKAREFLVSLENISSKV